MNNPFENVKQKPRYEMIYSELKKKIVDNKISIGEKLPTEKELIEYYKVSRITTKKALDMLVNDNLVERIPGKGSFVKNYQDHSELHRSDKKGFLLGYIVPDFDDSHGLDLLIATEKMAKQKSVNLVVKQTYGDINLEKEAIHSLMKQGVDGLIIMPASGEYYNEEIVKLNLEKFPHVLIDRYLKGFTTTSICSNNKEITNEAVHYLFDLNHEKIALFSPPYKDTSAIEDRIEGFIQAYAERGILVDKKIWLAELASTLPVPKNEEEEIKRDVELIKHHLKNNQEITAIFAMEYNIAMLAREAMTEMELKIPDDISIICFDNPRNTVGRYSFTHIKQDVNEMAEKAVEGIISLIEGKEYPVKTFLEGKLIEKQSTAINQLKENGSKNE